MKRIFLLCLVLLILGPMMEVSASSKEPEVRVSEADLATNGDDHGLKRLGDFDRLHFFGYGELHYNSNIGPTENEIDFHRLVLGFGYDFTDWVMFRAELDFEHAFTEPELEFAYVDFLIRDYFNVRLGAVLIPMGIINQHHEPPTFNGVERPSLYRVLIPTSWQEAGAGFHGKFGHGFEYELYAVTTPDAEGYTGSNGIRGGRGKIAEAPGHDFGVTGRLQYTGISGLRVGTSVFAGNTGQGDSSFDGAFLSMLEFDAKYSFSGIDLEGIFVMNNVSDAGNISRALQARAIAAGDVFTNFVASRMLGWYVEGAYHLFHHLLPNTKHDLILFGRFEDFNTQSSMPAGFAANRANDRNTFTTGLTYLPIPQVAIKADYNFNWNAANAGVDQFNLGLGFYY